MPLKPSGKTPTSSPSVSSRSASSLQASVRAHLAGHRADDRHLEDQVGAEQPQVALRRVVVVQGDRVISASSGSVPEWLATTSAPPVGGHVLQAVGLDPEPLLVQRPQERQQDVVGEVGVEAELVGLVLPGQPAAQERRSASGDAGPPSRGVRRPAGRTARRRRAAAG